MKKQKEIVIFDPGSIELAFTGKVSKNTLPVVREAWTQWLASFDAKNLKTDEDFKDAATFVTECKRVEERLSEIRDTALKGDVFKAIKELEVMQETTRQKRLEFDRAVTARKNDIKTDAIKCAMDKVEAELRTMKHRMPDIDADARLLAAIKGKSAILKMDEALQLESAKILTEALQYNDKYENLLHKVQLVYADAGETCTDSEINMLMKTYFEDAPERAKMICQQKKLDRDQKELEKQKSVSATAAVPAPAPIQEAPAAKDCPILTIRFGVTFTCYNTADVEAKLKAIGGTNIKFTPIQ
jgi:hypothetical protein